MGPEWFKNFMRVVAVIIILAIIAFTIAEFIGLLDLKDMSSDKNKVEISYHIDSGSPLSYFSLSSPQKNKATVPGPVCEPMTVPTSLISTSP